MMITLKQIYLGKGQLFKKIALKVVVILFMFQNCTFKKEAQSVYFFQELDNKGKLISYVILKTEISNEFRSDIYHFYEPLNYQFKTSIGENYQKIDGYWKVEQSHFKNKNTCNYFTKIKSLCDTCLIEEPDNLRLINCFKGIIQYKYNYDEVKAFHYFRTFNTFYGDFLLKEMFYDENYILLEERILSGSGIKHTTLKRIKNIPFTPQLPKY